jgi:hypothetical protein
MMTESPGATCLTPSPTRSTTPAPSWPRIAGNGIGRFPARVLASVWHTPLATIRTNASPRPGSSSSISCSSNGASWFSTTSLGVNGLRLG